MFQTCVGLKTLKTHVDTVFINLLLLYLIWHHLCNEFIGTDIFLNFTKELGIKRWSSSIIKHLWEIPTCLHILHMNMLAISVILYHTWSAVDVIAR